MEDKIEIFMDNGKYGIVDNTVEQVIIPFEYDNIFKVNKIDLLFILNKSGKIGAIFINSDNSYNWIAPCEYDYYCGSRNLSFYNDCETRCFFLCDQN